MRKAAVPQNPHRGLSDYLLGFLYVGEERYPEALSSFATAASGGAISRNEYYASAYAAQRQFAKASETYAGGHASEVASEDIDSYTTQASIAADQGKWNEALGELGTAVREAGAIGPTKTARFRASELALKALSAPRTETLAELQTLLQTTTIVAKDDTTDAEASFQTLLAAYLAARLGDDKLASRSLATDVPEARGGQYPILKQMLAIAEAEQLARQGKYDDALTKLKLLVDGTELCLVHQALLDAYAASGRNEDALREALWLASHRGRAYAEYNVQRILTPLNVVQSDLALLSAAELAAKLGRKDEAKGHLAEFRKAWPDADRIGFVTARVKALDAALAAPAR
jgi:tetratricopeptide (TPR) repeat protein